MRSERRVIGIATLASAQSELTSNVVVEQVLFRSGSIKSEEPDELPDAAVSGMGAFTKADAYDEEQIFKHLVFYLDSSDNAKENELPGPRGKTPSSDDREKSSKSDKKLEEAGKKLMAGGGELTDKLDEPSLTHIIVGDDTSR